MTEADRAGRQSSDIGSDDQGRHDRAECQQAADQNLLTFQQAVGTQQAEHQSGGENDAGPQVFPDTKAEVSGQRFVERKVIRFPHGLATLVRPMLISPTSATTTDSSSQPREPGNMTIRCPIRCPVIAV